ncbi:MAG: hypothetical protein COA78_29570 [Blastopirellula sp.]|nr:MAG: hypothetical protein COA78_29570 [Blastopirellula sp.]
MITFKAGKLRLNLNYQKAENEPRSNPVGTSSATPADDILTLSDLRLLEANNIRRALELTGGKIYGTDGAAKLLDMKPTTLASRIKKLEID